MYKLLLQKDNNIINTVNGWRESAPPKQSSQWQDGRSAKELAKYFINSYGHMPKEIEQLLHDLNISEDIQFIGEPEAVTNFSTKGFGRNHDLLIKAANNIVIGIEAKVDEPLGDYVLDILRSDKTTDNKKMRIEKFYNEIYGEDRKYTPNVRYQLLHATSGTLIEAKKANASKALFVILTFKTNCNYNFEKGLLNEEDINAFINSLGTPKINGAYQLPGYKEIECYIRHIVI